MKDLYPLKFRPIYKDKIWGGQKIKEVLGKDFGNLPNCGESWVISGVDGDISVVDGGALEGKDLVSLIEEYKDGLLGNQVYTKFGTRFPLLIKFIDANDDLSVQVHPDDKLAGIRHNSFGKTEMWYILQADKGARLVTGFNKPLDQEEYLKVFNEGKLYDVLNQEDVSKEDMFFIPAGRVHTIGKGILLAEIQQTSDITYRIYDFDRVDSNGKGRELHLEEALGAIDYTFHNQYKTAYKNLTNEPVELAKCEYFLTNKLQFNKPLARNYSQIDSFVIYICYEGSVSLKFNGGAIEIGMGDAVLLPAKFKDVVLIPNSEAKILESFVPFYK